LLLRHSYRENPAQHGTGDAAYTLIELTVVVFLMGLMLVLTMPRVQHTFLSDDLKTATRRMIGTVKTLKERAVREQKGYKLYLDMESNSFWVEREAMTEEEQSEARQNASRFPGSVRILDVSRPGMGTKSVGDAVIHFSKKGYMEQAVIHLGTGNDKVSTIVLNPFLGVVKTFDQYVDVENI